jgi:hypothetical protein
MSDLDLIFLEIRSLLQKYSPPFVAKVSTEDFYDLWSIRDLVIEGRKRSEVYFAAVKKNKGYVGFYFMPVYIESEQKKLIPPDLLKCLKGKSCFHIKTLSAELIQQIGQGLNVGFQLYKERGWIE